MERYSTHPKPNINIMQQKALLDKPTKKLKWNCKTYSKEEKIE